MVRMKQIVQTLEKRHPLQPLKPESIWDRELDRNIASLSFRELSGDSERMSYAMAFKSGLHLWNDSLDLSHKLSQDIHHETGSYWHGIMHRMEGDYSNSKYWFHRVGNHPVFPELNRRVNEYVNGEANIASLPEGKVKRALETMAAQTSWNPYLFIDAVQMALSQDMNGEAEHVLRTIQRIEMAVLLQFTYQQCFGGTILDTI